MAKRGLLDHEKTMNLAESLKIFDVYALGLLEAFFQWTAKYHPNGDVTGVQPKTFARTIRYYKDPQRLWDSLISAGFIDVLENGVSVVHDWSEHADNAVHQLLKKRHELFADGQKPFARNSPKVHEPDTNGSQTVHEPFTNGSHRIHKPFTNHSRLPEPEPEPEPFIAMEGTDGLVTESGSRTHPVAPSLRKKHNHGGLQHASFAPFR